MTPLSIVFISTLVLCGGLLGVKVYEVRTGKLLFMRRWVSDKKDRSIKNLVVAIIDWIEHFLHQGIEKLYIGMKYVVALVTDLSLHATHEGASQIAKIAKVTQQNIVKRKDGTSTYLQEIKEHKEELRKKGKSKETIKKVEE